MNEHKISLSTLYKKVKSSEQGLTSKEVEHRLEENGLNILESKKKTFIVFKFLKQFTNFFALLLIGGSLLAFLAESVAPGQGNLYIAIALIGVVLLNAIFTFIQEYQSEKIMETFNQMLPSKSKVLRDGKISEIESKNVVVGDILIFGEGDKIAADARIIEINALKVDNSSITGESEPQLRKLEHTHKNILESRNMVFSGTLVQSGNAKAVVYNTGMNTQIGNIVKLTKETKEVETPLKKELRHFIKIISTIAITLGAVFFVVSLLIGNPLIGSIIFAIGIIVANVPEGLLPTVTLCLSIASKKMAKKNALIKNLESVETLGSTTVICTDKTGTITQNKIVVNTLFMNFKEFDVLNKEIAMTKGITHILKTMVLCNNSTPGKNKTYYGDPTETSLMNFSENLIDVSKTISTHKRVHESPFDSNTKRMITTYQLGSKKTAYIKGAPEVVIDKCQDILIDGKIRKLLQKDRSKILNYYKEIASRGERVLAFAFKETKTNKATEVEFVFVGLVGMLDQPRKEVYGAIKKCHSAGIKVIMITGDYSLTAESIARKVGLVSNGATASILTGEELEKISDKKLKEFLKKDNLIFARTNPGHKLRIVRALQSMGEIVTVTGDGVNDAPALKHADMGIAMGLSGTEVAREASNMVLMDDNFATIVYAIEEGRTIYENIKKFIAYILRSNIPEILPFIAFVLLGIPLPMTVVLILAIDLGTDLIPAIGLGTEKSEADVMNNKPKLRSERLLTPQLLFMSYGIIGMLEAAAGFFAYFVVLFRGGWVWGQELAFSNPLYQKAITAFFVSIIICQIADVWICRTRRQSVFKSGFFSNKVILAGILCEIVLVVVIAYLPQANVFFGTAPLTLFELMLPVPFAMVILSGDEFRKYLVRKDNAFVLRYLNW